MKNIDIHFEKSEIKDEYVNGVAWLLKHCFKPEDAKMIKFRGEYKNSKNSFEKFPMVVEWSNNTGWKVELKELVRPSGTVHSMAVKEDEGHKPIPSFERQELKEAILAMLDYLGEVESNYRLVIVRKD